MAPRVLLSAGHAYDGLKVALQGERNLQIFLVVYVSLLLAALPLYLRPWEWFGLLLGGGFFLSVELLNTALERLADSIDDHCKKEHGSNCFTALRSAKDIAAAASLICLIVLVLIVLVIFLPRIVYFCLSKKLLT